MVCPISPELDGVSYSMKQATTPHSSPSVSVSPPGLLQSSSSSTAGPSINEPQDSPHTPPRGRPKYPSGLALGGPRVPLHRRGTSKTYERLEDLLQEAGYKETRIFTPETERLRDYERGLRERPQMDGRVKGGMDTVVGFLTGLVSGQADIQRVHGNHSQNESTQPRPQSSNGECSKAFLEDVGPHSVNSPDPTPAASLFQARGRPDQSLGSDGVTNNERSSDVHPSPARAYLRHIASAPNIPRRRVPGERAPPPVMKKSTISLKDRLNVRDSPPPMPPSWLETVARAVLGFHGSHVQRNGAARSPNQSRFESPSHPASRSSTVRGYGRLTRKRQAAVFGDIAAKQRGRSTRSLLANPQPPNMLVARSQASLGEVVKLNVVCRSAPASRSSSVTRNKPRRDESLATASLGNLSNGSVRGKGKALQSTSRNIRRKSGRSCGPNLRDQVEDDGSTFHTAEEREGYDSSSEDEDEDEVDLSKLLVPPRRQQSIKSLRRQLSRSHAGDANASGIAGTWTVRGDNDSALTPDDRGRIRRGSVNDGDWSTLVPPASYRDNRTPHKRREIPVSWTQQVGGKLPGTPCRRER